MAIALYPLGISPCAVGLDFASDPIVPVGGTGPYTWGVTGAMPPGLYLNTATPGQVQVSGRALVADQYVNDPFKSIPEIKNPSTYTITVTDSLSATASVTYTQPVFLFSESECISVYEMLAAAYQPQDPTLSNFYVCMSNMGTQALNIGEIGAMLFGSLTLIINAYLNNFTQGMSKRLREYLCTWDKIKATSQSQDHGAVGNSITGLSNSWEVKRQLVLRLFKSIMPVFTKAEIDARNAHGGGSDSTGSTTGAEGGDSSLSVN